MIEHGFQPFRYDGSEIMARDPFPDPFPAPLPPSFRFPSDWDGKQERAAECPAFERRSGRWQESSHIARRGYARPDCCVELARFVVPQGCTGIVHRIATSIEVYDDESGEAQAVFFVGLDPFVLERISGGVPGKGIRFHLRIEPYNQNEDRNLGTVVTTSNQLPGKPHPELGTWNDSRYWYGFFANRTRIRVPERSRLSLWIEVGVDAAAIRSLTGLYGLLQGHVWQYPGNDAAYWDAQRGLI